MMNAALSIWGVDLPDPSSFANRADPAVGGAPVEALTVVPQQDRSVSPFADGEIKCARRARDQGNEGGFVALADDPQHPMASLESHIVDVGLAGFAHSQAIQPE
jgi:hypothetical protein